MPVTAAALSGTDHVAVASMLKPARLVLPSGARNRGHLVAGVEGDV